MRRSLILSVLATLSFCFFSSSDARAQSNEGRVELGADVTVLRYHDLQFTDVGIGGRATYFVTNNFGLEAELNVFPQDKIDLNGRKTEGLFGGLVGIRSHGAGIYGKFRAGFLHFSRDGDGNPIGTTDFALDYGGVLELYPSNHTYVRFDLGDTYIRFGNNQVVGTSFGPVGGGFGSHNFQFTAGVGVRF